MKVVHMTRVEPEVVGGPTALDVQEQDVAVLATRGWVAAEEKKSSDKTSEPVKKSETVEKAVTHKDKKVKED